MGSGVGVPGVDMDVEVDTGVIGEIDFGLRVCVAMGKGVFVGAGRVRVGLTTIVGVTSAAQAVIKTHNNKTHKSFISISISKKWDDYFMLNLRS